MVKESTQDNVHCCGCQCCQKHPRGKVAADHRALNRLLAVSNERIRRWIVGLLAEQVGRGGISRLARITGMDRNTIAKGRRELHDRDAFLLRGSPRVRRPGAGRKRVEMHYPGL